MKILEKSGCKYEVVDYMNSPPTPSELQSLATKMALRPKNFIRQRETIFKDLNLKTLLENDNLLLTHMSKNPKLIERPIIERGDKAVLGRPPENIIDLIKK